MFIQIRNWNLFRRSLYLLTLKCLPAGLLAGDLLDVLASLVLDLLTVNEVKTPGLDLTVDEGTSETGHDLLGLLVARSLAYKYPLLASGDLVFGTVSYRGAIG